MCEQPGHNLKVRRERVSLDEKGKFCAFFVTPEELANVIVEWIECQAQLAQTPFRYRNVLTHQFPAPSRHSLGTGEWDDPA
jgi:hypothetical protein